MGFNSRDLCSRKGWNHMRSKVNDLQSRIATVERRKLGGSPSIKLA